MAPCLNFKEMLCNRLFSARAERSSRKRLRYASYVLVSGSAL